MKPTRFATLALLTTVSLAVPLIGQTAPSPAAGQGEGPTQLEAFTVTGTHIRRIEEERAIPVTVFDADELAARSASTAAELFETLPGGAEMTLDENNVLGADARGDNASVNLRGIGAGNTLVLLNGRRMAPHPISQAASGVPSLAANVNQLPTFGAKRIEILRDGASAIYGADAAAGVINVLLSTDYDGFDVNGRATATEDGGGDERRVTLSFGKNFNRGRSNITGAFDYYHRDLLRASDRDWAQDTDHRPRAPAPWNGQPLVNAAGSTIRDNDFDSSSTASNYGNFIRGAFNSEGAFVGARPAGNRGITTSTAPSAVAKMTTAGIFYMSPLADGGTGFRSTAPSRNIDGVEHPYYYNLNLNRALLPETDRATFIGQLDHELTAKIAFRGELFFYDARSETRRDPSGVDSQDDAGMYVSANNPWNPFGSRFYHPTGAANPDSTPRLVGTPAEVLIAPSTGVRPREFRERIVDVHSQALRLVGELRGPAWGDFRWLAGAAYGRANTRDEEQFNVRDSKLRAALLRTDETAFNPFGYTFRIGANNQIVVDQPYTNSASVVDPLYDTFVREGRTELVLADLKFDGTLFQWRNIPVSAAFGAEFRFETYKDWRPPYHGQNPANDPDPLVAPGDNDFIGLSPNVNLYSDRSVISGFLEIFAPLINKRNRMKVAHSLDLSAAVRTEHFSDFGDATKPKVAIGFRPVSSALLRASYAESFRAPNLVQTNTTTLQRSVTGISDPYRSDVTNLITDGSSSRTVFRQGNASLSPEDSNTITLGIAIEVPRVKGLSFTFDYFRINQNQVIDNLSSTEQLLRDEARLDAETQRQLAAGTSIGSVDLGSGTASYLGNAKVTRAPVTAPDLAFFNSFNASHPPSEQRAPVGRVISVVDDYLNLAGRDVAGWEASVQYRLPRTRFGQFSVRGEVTHMKRFDEKLDENSPVESLLEENGRPIWRGNASVTWRHRGWYASWFTSYWGEFVDTSASTTAAVYEALNYPDYIRHYYNDGIERFYYRVKPAMVHNASVSYAFDRRRDGLLGNVRVRLGVLNVLDREPPLADESRGTRGGAVSSRGRTYTLDIGKRF